MKWTVLGTSENLERYVFLSNYLSDHGVANDFEVWQQQSVDFETFAELAEYDHVRLSGEWRLTIAKSIKLQSSWTSLLGVADGMIKSSKGWWPLCALYEAIGGLVVQIGSELKTSHSVLVAGSDAVARTCVAGLFKAGFRSFIITSVNEPEAKGMIKELQAKFFGMTIKWVPKEKIVLLPGESSVMVNCISSKDTQTFLTDLCYLNFLKRPGILIDISMAQESNQLVAEAIESGVHVYSGVELASRVDVLWAEWAFKHKINLPDYRAAMIEKLGLKLPG